MVVTGINSATGNGYSIARGETKEVPDDFGSDLIRAGHARAASQAPVETMKLNQQAPMQEMRRERKHKRN